MKLKNIHLQIPNLLTLCNLFLGCIGILYAFDERYFVITKQGGIYTTEEVSNRLFMSCFVIFAAAVVDFLDGFIARALKAGSEKGKQLDSLADVVTFGVLPGIILYQLLSRSYFADTEAMHTSKWHMVLALIVPLAAAYRLARFNVVETTKEYFTGLATPAMAIFVATLPLILLTNPFGLGQYTINKYLLNVLVVVLSYLMISDIKMFSLKLKSFSIKENIKQYVFLLLCIASVFIFKYAGVAISILLYIFFSLFVIRFKTQEEL
jgi:CDP-diacylglycerol--serine O-phosphatidyltransferase